VRFSAAFNAGQALQVVETVETLLTALILAFMFRAFLVEAFLIPTGSMADGLLGRHGEMTCPTCGWTFAFALPESERDNRFPGLPVHVTCPNCYARSEPTAEVATIQPGDRVLVHKWPYALGGPFGPRRWDVIVFHDPARPRQNYIKRVVGLPGEEVQILDGDVYVRRPGQGEFQIARKTASAQRVLWTVVYDHDYPPRRDAGYRLPSPWRTDGNGLAGWSGLTTRVVRFEADDDRPRVARFEPPPQTDYLRDASGYNQELTYAWVGDVRMRAELRFERGTGWLEWRLDRDGVVFGARFEPGGVVRLWMRRAESSAGETLVGSRRTALRPGVPALIEFGHLDYRAYVRVNGRTVVQTSDTQYAPELQRLLRFRRTEPVRLEMIAAATRLTLRHLRIDRDVHYVVTPRTRRALPGQPFRLGKGEYFVLGDNSPASYDSREWNYADADYRGRSGEYHMGTVPAKQIVGQAFFVYLSGLQPVDAGRRWWLPRTGRMRWVR